MALIAFAGATSKAHRGGEMPPWLATVEFGYPLVSVEAW